MKKLISAFGAVAAWAAVAAAEPSYWQRPQTTHYYLQGPKAERLLVCWREGKVTVGEVRHEHDWQKTFYYREETTPEAFGVWLVHGEKDEPFDFRAATLRSERDATPIRAQSWRMGDLEVGLEACAPFGLRPSAHLRLRVGNVGTAPLTHRFALMLRTSKERNLVFAAPDLYAAYAPVREQWLKVPSSWKPGSDGDWRDGERFLAAAGASGFTWDGTLGAVRFDVSLAPGETRTFDFALGAGETERPDYAAARARTREDWRRELARIDGRSLLIRQLTVQMLQSFSRVPGRDYVLPRQGCLQRWVWPWDQMQAAAALGLLGYSDYVEDSLAFYFGEYAKPNGEIGPFGNGWACDTACVLQILARYCLDTGNAACWSRHRETAARAFGWIRARRRESKGRVDCVEGLFPPSKANDAKAVFQVWGMTDLLNLQSMEMYVQAAEKFGADDAAAACAEAEDYRATIAKVLDRWRKESEGRPTFFIPLDPNGTADADLRRRNYFCGYAGTFAALGFLSADEMVRVRNGLLQEGTADVRGLYMRHTTWLGDGGNAVTPETACNVWYTTSSELNWFRAWKRVGRDDLAQAALDACLRYSVTAEGAVGERYCSTNPWYFPWSPNASGAGRLVQMLLADEASASQR